MSATIARSRTSTQTRFLTINATQCDVLGAAAKGGQGVHLYIKGDVTLRISVPGMGHTAHEFTLAYVLLPDETSITSEEIFRRKGMTANNLADVPEEFWAVIPESWRQFQLLFPDRTDRRVVRYRWEGGAWRVDEWGTTSHETEQTWGERDRLIVWSPPRAFGLW